MKKLTVSMTRREIAWGWGYLLFQLLILPNLLTYGNLLLRTPLSVTALNLLFYALNFVCVFVIFHGFLKSSLRVSAAAPFHTLRAALLGFVIYYAANFVFGLLILYLRPDFSNVNDSSISAMAEEQYGLMSIATVLLVPPVEEVLYRGLIFRGLYDRSRLAAYAVSTAVFGAIHVVGYIGYYDLPLLLLCFVQYIPAGLCLGWTYAKADSIWAPILLHITINQIAMLSMR